MSRLRQRIWELARGGCGQRFGVVVRGPLPAAAPLGRRILVVDLDGRAGRPLAQALTRSGFEPHVVRRETAALGLIGQEPPEAMIVAGPANLNFYRALRRATPAPILALDPYADDERVLAAFAAGVDQFQAGSTGPEEIVARLQALLRRAAKGERP